MALDNTPSRREDIVVDAAPAYIATPENKQRAAKGGLPVTILPLRSQATGAQADIRHKKRRPNEEDEGKRDSGLAPADATADQNESQIPREENGLHPSKSNASYHTITSANPQVAQASTMPIGKTPFPTDTLDGGGSGSSGKDVQATAAVSPGGESIGSEDGFSPITTPIPSTSELKLDFMADLGVSKRGSVLLAGEKAINKRSHGDHITREAESITQNRGLVRALPDDVEKESQKVRSMYEVGAPLMWEDGRLPSIDTTTGETMNGSPSTQNGRLETVTESDPVSGRASTAAVSSYVGRSEHELAGGIEDWEDLEGAEVDRYGFILVHRQHQERGASPELGAPQRVSTVLQLASQVPRRRHGFPRSLSSARSSRTLPRRNASRRVSIGSLNTTETGMSQRPRSRVRSFRMAAHRLPGNRSRRLMDEAGDMLTLPPGLADIAEEDEGGRAVEGGKRKESSRTEKWRKMAKLVKTQGEGRGTEFEFDVKNPKLVERTWKGIPDRWRAAAWYSFLSASAKRKRGRPSDDQIVDDFHKLLGTSSADDVQIDMDVPRTINSHIMFRRRYRGGQRLLFRILHALSLYFPETGYVQGMASIAATLLCYYDEERAFIMLVRMWQERGLEKLYEPGFAGLMAALDEFEKEWMLGNDVSKKLDDFGIHPTAYGTRWYLTLFNYSIPFPAQLRVWDVFMLLGDADMAATPERPFGGGLDILHAASAALIDGTREILLDSDFENSMKVLTSWIPVKDEDLFMKVARVEWKLHAKRRN